MSIAPTPQAVGGRSAVWLGRRASALTHACQASSLWLWSVAPPSGHGRRAKAHASSKALLPQAPNGADHIPFQCAQRLPFALALGGATCEVGPCLRRVAGLCQSNPVED